MAVTYFLVGIKFLLSLVWFFEEKNPDCHFIILCSLSLSPTPHYTLFKDKDSISSMIVCTYVYVCLCDKYVCEHLSEHKVKREIERIPANAQTYTYTHTCIINSTLLFIVVMCTNIHTCE